LEEFALEEAAKENNEFAEVNWYVGYGHNT
jgi:hypothetical protein